MQDNKTTNSTISTDNNNNNNNNRKWTDVNYKFCKNTEKEKFDEEEIQTETSWEDVDWDHVREKTAEMLLASETEVFTDEVKNQYETNAMDYWDKFYKRNQSKFFKDRTYLHLEYPELNPLSINREQTTLYFNYINHQNNNQDTNNNEIGVETDQQQDNKFNINQVTEDMKWWLDIKESYGIENCASKVLEIGCGTGSSVWPMLKLNPEKYFYAFDFSPHAVQLVKSNPLYNPDRMNAFVCDIANEFLPTDIIKDNSIDLMLMIFVLSAISAEKMNHVATALFKALKPGGVVYVRDYGMYDMTQLRFLSKKGRKIDQNFYLRADGTRTYFFTTEVLVSIFEAAGFKTVLSKYDTRELRNRKKLISMYRVWVRGKFMKPLEN
eukprot:gene8391-10307_t